MGKEIKIIDLSDGALLGQLRKRYNFPEGQKISLEKLMNALLEDGYDYHSCIGNSLVFKKGEMK